MIPKSLTSLFVPHLHQNHQLFFIKSISNCLLRAVVAEQARLSSNGSSEKCKLGAEVQWFS
jgi:hypothetical protein